MALLAVMLIGYQCFENGVHIAHRLAQSADSGANASLGQGRAQMGAMPLSRPRARIHSPATLKTYLGNEGFTLLTKARCSSLLKMRQRMLNHVSRSGSAMRYPEPFLPL